MYAYDVLGRLKTRKDPDGVAQWTYDPANGKGAVGTRCYTHGAAARECGATPGFKETLAYNGQSRLSSSTTLLNVGTTRKSYQHRYTYDTRGRLSTAVYPTGLTVKSDYNARGYLEFLRDAAAPGTAAALQRYKAMNAYGQVTRESYANGVSTVRSFDPKSGRLTGIDTTMGATTLQDNVYAWQSNGILKSRMSGSGMSARTETFAYDALDRLRSAVTDLAGRAGARTLSMTYDRLGNLKGKGSLVTGDTGASAYVYGKGTSGQPELTELASVTIGGVSHSLRHDDWGRVDRYDRDGTTTEDRYIGWNARHLPRTVTVGDSLADTTPKAKDEFLYGPDGQRYYKKSTWEVPGADGMTPATYAVEHTYYAGTHREVVRVGDTTNLSVATSTVSASVLHVKTTPISGTATTAFEYLHRDHLGSVESVTGAAGTELKVQAYDPFGSRRASDWTRALTDTERNALTGEAPQRTARGYTGHEHLERTGLIHMNGRVYDPAIGRFLSPDPVVPDASFSQSWNPYSS